MLRGVLSAIIPRDLSMTEEQQAAKYISVIKYSTQEHVIIHDVFSIEEAHNKALNIERLQCSTLLSKPSTPVEDATIETFAAALVKIVALVAKGKENSYAKPGLASVTGVVNLNTSPMSVQRGGNST